MYSDIAVQRESQVNADILMITNNETSNNVPDYSKYPRKIGSVSYIEFFWTVTSIVMRMTSVFLNMFLAYEYYSKEKYNYFAWTVSCILIPMAITTLISIFMYIEDTKNSCERENYGFFGFIWFVIIMPFLFRYCQSLTYAIESKTAEKRNDKENQKKFYDYMIKEESDVALIRIFECFLEAAPQKVLQISIILGGEDKITLMQFASISSCLASMTWCIVVYHKYNRYTQPDKENISCCGQVMQCLWHFFIAVSRVLSISIVASLFPMWTLYACCIHAFILGLIVFFYDNPTFCSRNILTSFAFSLTLGIVYIFTYITPKDVRTRYRFSCYYIICVLENIACLTLYIINSNEIVKSSNYFITLCIFAITPYFMGIICMIFYYTMFHPNVTARLTNSFHN